MNGPPVVGDAVTSPVMLVGQAPGSRETTLCKPFAWTAGKTLFSWFRQLGLDERGVRSRVYMTAVCRCFPGKKPKGGDRPPSRLEVANCGRWLQTELSLLQPALLLPVGKLAIQQFIPVSRLDEVVGTQRQLTLVTDSVDIIPLPHPSGASTWHRTEPGKSLLQQALRLIGDHPAWRGLVLG
jgi:uracil-DNA glycosylase